MSDRLARGNPLLNTDAMLAKVVPPSWQSNSLAKIASQIRIETEAAEAAAEEAAVATKTLADANHREIYHRMSAGDLLIEAKAQVPHGEWLPWLESNLAMSDRSARVWMQLAKGREKIEAEIGSRDDGA